MNISFAQRVVIPERVMVRRIGDESVILDLDSESYFGLDDVGSDIWAALAATETIEAAYERLLAEYDVEPEELRLRLREFVEKLVETGLIHVRDD